MARYRKCPRPCAQGNSCKWKSKMLQQVPPLRCPYFLKNVSSFMLWRPSNPCPRLEIPADFVQEHGDKFNGMVEVKGPCKSTWNMRANILVCKFRRVMLDHGWRDLVIDLGLNQGDHVLFVLTAFSKFKVYVFDDVGVRRRFHSFQANFNGNNNNNNTNTNNNSNNNNNIASPSATSTLKPLNPPCNENENKGTEQALWEEDGTTVPEPWKRRLRGNSTAAKPVVVVELSDDNCQEPSESEYTLKGRASSLQDTDSLQSSQRSAFQKTAFSNKTSRSQSFIKKVPAISLKNEDGAHLEVPATFTQRHDGLFKEHISLQGPTGRKWQVVCQITVQQQYRRVKLRAGWLNFAVDNMVKLHDQLLFTHVTEGQFRVQIVTKGHRRRGRPRQNSSPGKLHQDGARVIPKDQVRTPETPTSNLQQSDINKDVLESKIHNLQQQLLAQKRTVHKKVEDRCTTRRGRMEWGLGHS